MQPLTVPEFLGVGDYVSPRPPHSLENEISGFQNIIDLELIWQSSYTHRQTHSCTHKQLHVNVYVYNYLLSYIGMLKCFLTFKFALCLEQPEKSYWLRIRFLTSCTLSCIVSLRHFLKTKYKSDFFLIIFYLNSVLV